MSHPDPKRRKTDDNDEANTKKNHDDVRVVEFVYKGQPKVQIPAGVSHVSTSPRVKKIKDEYFYCCKPLRFVALGKSVSTIGRSVFQGCSNLVQVDLQEGLTEIGRSAFYGCTSLIEMELPKTVEIVHWGSFRGCTSLIRLRCHEGLTTIETTAFKGCCSLVEIVLPWGLKTIGGGAFQDCTSLAAVALPGTLLGVLSSAFRGCTNLLGVEVRTEIVNAFLGDRIFSGCQDLVNIAWPRKHVFEGCHMLENNIDALRGRYDGHPVHRSCYYSSQVTVEGLVELLGSESASDLNQLEDCFGMTPFHIVATSVHPRTDILQCLLDRYPYEVLERKNKNGKTMMDYLLQHTSPEAVPPLKLLLEKVILESVSKWKLGDKHKLELGRRLAAIPNDHGTKSRRNRVNEFLQYVGYCTRLGQTSLMELTMWKMKIAEVSIEVSGSETIVDRTSCLYQTGADRVVNNVAKYLWGRTSTTSTALSIFSLLSEDETNA